MNLERYAFKSNDKHLDYEFISIGPQGKIKKIVRFTLVESDEVEFYNLAFGDWNNKTGSINDINISNNADIEKILATVAAIVYDFFLIYPNALLYAEGSTTSRTRRYQMGIARAWNEISLRFEVFGIKPDDTLEPFQKNINYEAFWIRRKRNF